VPRLYYVPVEALNARYTGQLGGKWFPAAFKDVAHGTDWTLHRVAAPEVSAEIRHGQVLDGTNRGLVSLSQMTTLLQRLDRVDRSDVIYLQDYWTPGVEALLYALHQRGTGLPRIYARNFAQSVDEYDFTWPMRAWMRPMEVGLSHALAGVFVASEVHRQQLRAAGYACPVHVTGLPIDIREVTRRMPPPDGRPGERVIYTSRLNAEKNPFFMLEVAEHFLDTYSDWTWLVTSSAAQFTTEVPGLLHAIDDLQVRTGGRFSAQAGLSKDEYYAALAGSAIQFNCALQDYVSFTLLEATLAGCDICYPDFRSFAECVPASRRYQAFDVDAAVQVLARAAAQHEAHPRPARVCHDGLRAEIGVMLCDYRGPELNVWHHPQSVLRAYGLFAPGTGLA
jgi:glycosyltransferase involved in cell wall biosynthesis